jgi:sigma-B regulation protein RsbU (phosphoserine phosphatase)
MNESVDTKGGTMEEGMFSRFAENLKTQHRSLVQWLRNSPGSKKTLRLGDYPTEAVEEHLKVLESAIERAESKELGRCTVCHEFVEDHWLETNYTTCVCLDHLSGEERNTLEAELELSQKVQKALLPQTIPPVEGWDFAAYSQPASIVGGDYFDFLSFRDGGRAIIIADVMGKGMPASMLMASIQASLRIILPESTSPDEVLSRLNRIFCHNIHLSKFVTIAILHLDPPSGLIRYANAGHNPPLVVHTKLAGGAVLVPLRPTGAAIGLVESAEFQTASAQMETGDQVVLYTDGVVEATNAGREEFGEERLRKYLADHAKDAPSLVIRGLRTAIRDFAGDQPQADDTTIVVCRRTA